MNQLAGEVLTGVPAPEGYVSADMERGRQLEPIAFADFCARHAVQARTSGFAYRPDIHAGCSPDGLIDDDGSLEIKTCKPHILVDVHRRKRFPPEHKVQLQTTMLVLDTDWIYAYLFSEGIDNVAPDAPGLRPYLERVDRDEAECDRILGGVAKFNEELEALVDDLKEGRQPAPAPGETPIDETPPAFG